MKEINWSEFEQVELRVGVILEVSEYPEARNPSYKLVIDFGDEIGTRKSSAQITHHYEIQELVGKQVVCVINFPKKQIGKFMSECLVTGFYDENNNVILCVPDKKSPLGTKLV